MSTRTAHRPMLAPEGLDARKVQKGEGFMLYLIDAGRNHSKFYEGIMLPNDDGTWRVKLRWGALTDSGFTGRIDGAKFDARYSHLGEREAKALLSKKYTQKTRKGYVDAWKHKLPKGQYPVGLKRDVGFGWGTQDAAFCIPDLRTIREKLDAARAAVGRDPNAVIEGIEEAQAFNRRLMRSDSTMGGKISKNLGQLAERARRFLNGLDTARNMKTALSRLISYLDKQLSVCHGKVAEWHAKQAADFNPEDIGKVKKPSGDPDEMRIVEDTDQRWFSEVADLYPSTQPVWDGTGYQRKQAALNRVVARYVKAGGLYGGR